MKKIELIEAVLKSQKDKELTKKFVNDILDSAFHAISKSIKKKKRFSYRGFGTFALKQRKARMGRNPQTGEAITIKESKTVGFKPARALKNCL